MFASFLSFLPVPLLPLFSCFLFAVFSDLACLSSVFSVFSPPFLPFFLLLYVASLLQACNYPKMLQQVRILCQPMLTKRLPQQSERKRSVASASSGALQHLLRDHPLNELAPKKGLQVGIWPLADMTPKKDDSTAVTQQYGNDWQCISRSCIHGIALWIQWFGLVMHLPICFTQIWRNHKFVIQHNLSKLM